MTVYVSKLEVRNYRSCVNTELNLSPFTALIGRNNCGKSNCISALCWLVRKSTLGLADFNNAAQQIEVVGVLVGITEADLGTLEATHRNRIQGYVVDQQLTIRRTQAAPKVAPSLSVWNAAENTWAPNPAGIDQALQALFPEPIRIGAMENAEEDASKAKSSTTIGKLLTTMLTSISERHEADVAPHLASITSMLSATGGNRFEELGRLDTSINEKIEDLFPGMSIKLDFQVPALADLIKAGSVSVFEGGGQGRPFGFYGHGAQRAIQMALVRHLAEIKRGEGVDGGATLLLVDEPELYLHPFAVEQVREALRTLSASGYQVVFSTHSSQMVLSSDAKNALLMTKETEVGTKARPRLKQVIQDREQHAGHQMAQLFSLTNSSQILFADKVVLTEGKTELRLLPGIFHTISGRTLGQASIALVAQSGGNDTKKSMEILGALGLPSLAVVDLDFAFRNAVPHGLLASDDADLIACKRVVARLAEGGEFKLDPDSGLPVRKGSSLRVFQVFERLAADQEAIPHIANLVAKLRAQHVWLWKKGAIEAHLGLTEKKESCWLDFQVRCDAHGLEPSCADYPEVKALVEWMAEA